MGDCKKYERYLNMLQTMVIDQIAINVTRGYIKPNRVLFEMRDNKQGR